MYCRHCSFDLEIGDVFDVLKQKHPELSDEEIGKKAALYGWKPFARVSFTKERIVQSEDGPQYTECPSCKGRAPLRPQ